MSRSDHERIMKVLGEALALPAEQRPAFLAGACADDPALRDDVAELLRCAPTANRLFSGADLAAAVETAQPPDIGNYHLLHPVGEGGTGIVYKAEQRHPVKRVVALKLIKLGLDTGDVIARFEGERQALAMMNHPNIAKVFDAGVSPTGRPFFVMEFVAGEPITTFCDRQHYTTRQRLELFTQACEAVQHAHQKAIIHRDLKPSNLLVTLEGGAPLLKVIDFGVAKAVAQRLTERTLFTEAGQLIGTPEYMSPEQADLGQLDIDTRSDIYSLGVVLYELLSGALPFDSNSLRGEGFVAFQRVIGEVDPPRPSARVSTLGDRAAEIASRRKAGVHELVQQLRGELEWIPLKAMRKERAARYRTASEMADDVRNYLAHRPLIAGPESPTYRLRKFLKRNRGPALAAAAVLVVLVVGITVTTGALIGQNRARRDAEAQRAEAQRQAREASQQAQIAQAVNDFQQEMLNAADPQRMLGNKVTVLQAMEAAIERLNHGAFKDQPLVDAAVRETIGNTLTSLSEFDRAEPFLREALRLRRATLSPAHSEIAQSLNNLAVLLWERGKLAEAETLYRESLAIRRTSLPPGHEDIAVGLNNLALLLRDSGKPAEAEPLAREALDTWRRALPEDDYRIPTALSTLGLLLQDQRKFAEAESLYREALAIRRRSMPPGHPRIAESLNNVALVLRERGHLDEAEPLYREALAINRATLPPGHPHLIRSLNNLARLLHAQGKLTEADPLLREALDMARQSLPGDHLDVVRGLHNLAMLLFDQERFAEAEPLVKELYERIATAQIPPDLAARYAAPYGLCLVKLARYAEAEPPLREAHRRLRDTGQQNDLTMRGVLAALAELCEQTGRRDEALRWRADLEGIEATTRAATQPAGIAPANR